MSVLSEKSAKRVVLIISIGLLISSLTQKCYCTTTLCNDSSFVFLLGPLGFFYSWAGATWLANPLLITSWIVINRNPKMSLITSLLATILSLCFLLFHKILDNENGDVREITGYQLGYWLWVASSVSMLIGNSLLCFSKPKPPII